MDLLEFGMRCADSKSAMKRIAAKAALAAAKKHADRYEVYVMRKKITIPENTQENAAVLEKIYKKIAEQSSASTAANEIK